MDSKLMNTFTNEQLLMCEKETLIKYINDIKKELPKSFELYPYFKTFIEGRYREADMITTVKTKQMLAPTMFDDIYFEFKGFCLEYGYKRPDKKQTKNLLIEHQTLSNYGLCLGKNLKEGKPNGSEMRPYFNLILMEEEEQTV